MHVTHEHQLITAVSFVPITKSLLTVYHPPILVVCERIDAMGARLRNVTAFCFLKFGRRVDDNLLHVEL